MFSLSRRMKKIKKMRPNIKVIYTGGTIGMVKSKDGHYVPASLDRLLEYVPNLAEIGANLSFESFDKPLDSTFVGPNEWLEIAGVIRNQLQQFDGFVVLHGTDTMAYTSSALSFLLKGALKPIVITGSQIPICEEGSDGVENFYNALKIASDGRVKEVALWFHKSLYKGACVTKVDTKSMNGFSSPNHPVLAKLSSGIEYENTDEKLEKSAFFLDKINNSIFVLNFTPGMDLNLVAQWLESNTFKGIILSALGLGNLPIKITDSIYKQLFKMKLPILVISDCLKGGVEIGKYEAGHALSALNAISGGKMTKEAAVTKLMIAVANFNNEKDVRDYLIKNQVGEY